MERILEAEMSNHLGYERGDRTTAGKSGNTRNGKSPKVSPDLISLATHAVWEDIQA